MGQEAFNSSGWSGYFTVTAAVALVAEAVTNLVIDLANAPAEFWAAVQSDGRDIRIVNAVGDTVYSFELSNFSVGSQTGLVFFNSVGLSTSVDTTYRVYAGNAGATMPAVTDTLGRNGVWDSNYVLVCHMEADPTGSAPQFVDSTGNGHNGTANGSMASGSRVAAQLGFGSDADGSDDYIDFGSVGADIGGLGVATIEAWTKRTSGSGVGSRVGVGCGTGAGSNGHKFHFLVWEDGNVYNYVASTTSQAAVWGSAGGTAWRRTYMGFDGSLSGTNRVLMRSNAVTLSVAGSVGTLTATLPSAANLANFQVHRDQITTGIRWTGGIADEVRLSKIKRTADYDTTHYNNQSNPATFWSTGAWTLNGNRRRRFLCGAAA